MTTRAAGAVLVLALAGCGGSASEESRAPLGAGMQELEAGTHVLDLVARDEKGTGPARLPRIEITLPDGWFNFDGWGLSKGEERPFPLAVSFWDVDQVYPTPCRWAGKPMVDPGRGVASLADALARQPLRGTGTPTDVTLAGSSGKYLELSVPTDIAFDEARASEALFPNCDEATFQSWTANGWAGDRFQQAPGQLDRIWMLDVDGERLVVDAWHLPTTTEEDRAQLDRVVKSIRFLD